MTPAQKVMLMIDLPAKGGRRASVSLFTQAAKIQGWNKSDRELRLKVFSLAVTFQFFSVLEFREALENYESIRAHPPSNVRFRHLTTASDLNNREDVDAVKILLLMLADNLDAANEQGKTEIGAGRRRRDRLADHLKCLALFPLEKPMCADGAQAFLAEIINDKFNRARKFSKMTLDDVDDRPNFVRNEATGKLDEKPSQMEQLLWTVNARLNGKNGYRAKAKYSMHDMYLAAGLPCACKQCLAGKISASPSEPIVPALNCDPELETALAADPELGADFGPGEGPF